MPVIPMVKPTVVLHNHQAVKIADPYDNIPDVFTMGLAWEMTGGRNVDLDASCIMLDGNLNLVDLVYFSKLSSSDGSVKHSGDEREGDEVGDDESITVNLPQVHPSVQYLGFTVNSYSGEKLNCVADARCRIYNAHTLKEHAQFELTDAKHLRYTALVMCVLYRVGPDWWMHAIGEGAHGTMAKDNVDELQMFIRQHNLWPAAKLQQVCKPSLPPQQRRRKKPVVVVVPQGVPAGGALQTTTPEGYTLQATVPAGTRPGTQLQLEQPDMATDRKSVV